jgi:hypothetical protein
VRLLSDLDRWRDREGEARLGGFGDDLGGVFEVKMKGITLRIIASVGGGWDHLSVSTRKRCPTWLEMEAVKRMFFKPDEVAMQLHVPPTDHISVHPHCLHIWRPHLGEIPLPPKWMVA